MARQSKAEKAAKAAQEAEIKKPLEGAPLDEALVDSASKQGEEPLAEEISKQDEKSSKEISDYQNHPKFAKFKTGVQTP